MTPVFSLPTYDLRPRLSATTSRVGDCRSAQLFGIGIVILVILFTPLRGVFSGCFFPECLAEEVAAMAVGALEGVGVDLAAVGGFGGFGGGGMSGGGGSSGSW